MNFTSSRKCSCCRSTYHTIVDCDSPNIDNFNKRCLAKSAQYSNTDFMNWLSMCIMDEGTCTVMVAYCLRIGLVYRAKELQGKVGKQHMIDILFTNFWIKGQRARITERMIQIKEQLETYNYFEDLQAVVVQIFELMDDLSIEESKHLLQSIENTIEHRVKRNENMCKVNVEKQEDTSVDLVECPICYDTKACCKYGCDHSVCAECYIKTSNATDTMKMVTCPMCRTPIKNMYVPTKEDWERIRDEIKTGNFMIV